MTPREIAAVFRAFVPVIGWDAAAVRSARPARSAGEQALYRGERYAIAQVRRGYSDPPQPLFRANGEPALGLAIAMREGGDILALGNNIQRAMAKDPFDLDRFVRAQDRRDSYRHAVVELRAGHKTSHWMWFVFPQLIGLGHSAMSRTYAIASLEQARAFLAHPVLGARLRECTALVGGPVRRRGRVGIRIAAAERRPPVLFEKFFPRRGVDGPGSKTANSWFD